MTIELLPNDPILPPPFSAAFFASLYHALPSLTIPIAKDIAPEPPFYYLCRILYINKLIPISVI